MLPDPRAVSWACTPLFSRRHCHSRVRLTLSPSLRAGKGYTYILSQLRCVPRVRCQVSVLSPHGDPLLRNVCLAWPIHPFCVATVTSAWRMLRLDARAVFWACIPLVFASVVTVAEVCAEIRCQVSFLSPNGGTFLHYRRNICLACATQDPCAFPPHHLLGMCYAGPLCIPTAPSAWRVLRFDIRAVS